VIIKIPESVRGGEVHFGLQYYSIVAKSMVSLSRTLDVVRDVSFDVRPLALSLAPVVVKRIF
jgi:hypothetical protein